MARTGGEPVSAEQEKTGKRVSSLSFHALVEAVARAYMMREGTVSRLEHFIYASEQSSKFDLFDALTRLTRSQAGLLSFRLGSRSALNARSPVYSVHVESSS